MKTIIRGLPIGIIVGIVDLSTLYLLSRYTSIDIKYCVYLSAFVSTIVSFIGNFMWTFKNSQNISSKKKKFFNFLILNLVIIYLSAITTIFTINKINLLISDYNINLFFIKNNKLTNLGNTIIRGIINGFYFVISVIFMSYIL